MSGRLGAPCGLVSRAGGTGGEGVGASGEAQVPHTAQPAKLRVQMGLPARGEPRRARSSGRAASWYPSRPCPLGRRGYTEAGS